MTSNSFVLLNDKACGSDIKMYSCCTTMDLLAMVSKDDHIIVMRFITWQKLLTIYKPSTHNGISISSIEWSPSGKMLAVGYDDGSVSIYNIENSKLLNSFPVSKNSDDTTSSTPSSPIHKMIWVKENSSLVSTGGTSVIDRFKNQLSLFPPLHSYFIDNNSSKDEESNSLRVDIYDGGFDILICCDTKGIISFFSLGLLRLATFNYFDYLKKTYSNQHFLLKSSNSIKILDLSITDSFKKLTIIGETDNGLYFTSTIDTSVLLKKRNEIHEMTLQYYLMNILFKAMQIHMDTILEKWKEATSFMTTKCNEFEKILQDYGFSSSIEQEFIDLLMSGVPSPPLNQFICNNLNNIKKLRQIETGCLENRQNMVKFIIPIFLNIFASVSKLSTDSKLFDRFNELLDQDQIESILNYSGSFGSKLSNIELLFGNMSSVYSSFFSWIYKVQCSLNEIEIDKKLYLPFNELSIMALLKKGLKNDIILSPPTAVPTLSSSGSFIKNSSNHSFLSSSNNLNNSSNIKKENPLEKEMQYPQLNGNFLDLYKEFQNKCTSIFDLAKKNIPTLFKGISFTPLCLYNKNDPSAIPRFTCSIISFSNDLVYLSFNTTLSSTNKLFIASNDSNNIWSFGCYQLAENHQVTDLKYFDQESLISITSLECPTKEKTNPTTTKKPIKYNTFMKQFQYFEKELVPLDIGIPPSTILLDLLDAILFCDEEDSFKSREILSKSTTYPINMVLSTQRKVSSILIGKRRMMVYDLTEDEEEEEEIQEDGQEEEDQE
ncbi:hypothetical protein CYY_005436 [Polysphondylium violaceum]|uniref:Anaphase-promoting complex subunit 4 n=1 Tax=Polysphondylium violaceum TaxID=133409 RepID=A0A8J4PWF6_9MYCE|nr:hypothetical protein CYY_005436 [Polysphondylium violaceum]